MDTPISPISDTHVETPEMGVSILNDGMGKPFSVRPVADDELKRYLISSIADSIYKLPHGLSNDLRHRILGD